MATFLERLRRDPSRVRLERLERLQALTEELSAAQTLDEVLRVVQEDALAAIEASAASLYRERAPGELELVQGVAVPEALLEGFRRLLADDPTPISEAYRTGRPLWVADPSDLQARFPAFAEAARPLAHAAWTALPLSTSQARGAVGLAFRDRRAFDEEERGFIVAVARQCTTAVERARLHEASHRFADRLRQILSVATALSAAASPRDVAAGAFRVLAALGASAAEIHGVSGEKVALLARHGRRPEEDRPAVAVDAPTPAAEVSRTGRAIFLETPEEIAERYPRLEGDRAARGEGAWAVVPLLASGRTLGALLVAFAEPRRLEADDRTYLRLVAQPCAQALDRARLADDAARARAEGDDGTALLAAAAAAAPVALAVLDRDLCFVHVNDAFAAADGISAATHLGRSAFDLLDLEEREPLLAAFHEVLATGGPVDVLLDAEVPAAPGARSALAATLFPIRLRGEIAAVGLHLEGGA